MNRTCDNGGLRSLLVPPCCVLCSYILSSTLIKKKKYTARDSRLSQRWCWRLNLKGNYAVCLGFWGLLCLHIQTQVVCLTLRIKAPRFFETSITMYLMIQFNLQKRYTVFSRAPLFLFLSDQKASEGNQINLLVNTVMPVLPGLGSIFIESSSLEADRGSFG